MATRNTETHPPGNGPAPSGYVPPQLGPVSYLLWRLALMPSSLGLGRGWNIVPGVRVKGARPTHHSSLGRAACLSLSGVKIESRPEAQKMASIHHLSVCLSVPPRQRAHHFSAGDQVTQDRGSSLPILWPRISTSQPHWGIGPLAPRNGRKRRWTKGQIGRLSWEHSASWWVNWQV